MSNSKPQDLKNHASFDPWFHVVLFLIFAVNFILSIVHLAIHRDLHSIWLGVLSFALMVMLFKMRIYPLKVQDRLIRLEERLRLKELDPIASKDLIARLSEDQLIGLRFASDVEVIALAKQAVQENLSRKQIKERIKSWRADYWRV